MHGTTERDQVNWNNHHYRSGDGTLNLFARDYPGLSSAVLLMHGLTRNSADFDGLAAHLAGRYRLIVPDQRGRGLSDYDPDAVNYRPDVYASDMWALLDSLQIDHAGLIGTSLGGLMAMIMAAAKPERISAIALNDVGTELMEEGIERIKSYTGHVSQMGDWGEAANRCKAINAAALPDLTVADWLAFARRTCSEQSDGTVAFAYDPAISKGLGSDQPSAVPADLWPIWDMIDAIPTLVLRGEISDVLAPATVTEMGRRHSGPFKSVTVPDRGHAPLLDEPVALEAINAFLGNHVR